MKRYFFIALAMLLSNVVFSQSDDKSLISLSFGPSFPTGDFKLKDIQDERAGLAKTGVHLYLSYSYRLHKNLGAIAVVKGNIHDISYGGYNIPDEFSMSVKTTNWRTIAAMGGIFGRFPLSQSNKFEMRLRGIAGIQQTYTPELDVTVIYLNSLSRTKQESSWGYGFAYLIGTDLQYYFNRRLGMVLTVDYHRSKTKFDGFYASRNGNPDSSSSQITSTLDPGLGLVVAF